MSSNIVTYKYSLARSLGGVYFWGSISIPYLVFRGFSIAEAFSLLSLYSILIVLLEFPTGVIGDYFGHKTSVLLSFIIGALSFILLALPLSKFAYTILTALAALSSALVSGSDDAYLRSISNNFRGDLSILRRNTNVIAAITLALAGYIASYSFSLPLIITAIAWAISAIIIYKLPNKKNKNNNNGNIFSLAGQSWKYVVGSISIISVFLYSSVNEGYQLAIKNLVNSSGPSLGIDIKYVSLIVGLGFLTRVVALQLESKLSIIKTRYFYGSIGLVLLAISMLEPSVYSAILIALTNFGVTIVNLRTDLKLHDLLSDHIRASAMSLKNLITRVSSSGYLLLSGYLIGNNNLQSLMLITFFLYAITGIVFLKLTNNKK